MRWQVHQLVGTVVDPVVPSTDPKEPTTVTPAEIIYHRRVRLLELAAELANVSAACRQMGISRTRYYEWRAIVARYGLAALMPKERRAPQLPNATPTHVLEELLTLAVLEPTLGCRQYADRLADRHYAIGKTTVQKHLADHGLGRRAQRVARAAAITAATCGLSTAASRDGEPFGFCHYSPAPGHQVAVDSFYIGHLKGVGKVYQLTAIDVATRWAIILIVLGTPTAAHTIRFIDHVVRLWRRRGVAVRAVLSDNGPEWKAGGFRAHLAARGLEHHRIPPRSPNHNAVCERFHGTVLQECWRPAFHRRRFTTIRQLQNEADAWLIGYHHRRRNHSDYMRGRTPAQILDTFRPRRAS
jgi:transposase InsO family protein